MKIMFESSADKRKKVIALTKLIDQMNYTCILYIQSCIMSWLKAGFWNHIEVVLSPGIIT